MDALLYADGRIFYSLCVPRLQEDLGVLVGLLDRVGLQTNMKETFGVIFQPRCTVGSQSEGAYTHHMMGVGPTYWAMQLYKVQWPDCGVELVAG